MLAIFANLPPVLAVRENGRISGWEADFDAVVRENGWIEDYCTKQATQLLG